jgi:sigma-B regulation protein RsbU (phosphoserine phosphatase)
LYDGESFSELESTGLVFGALPEIDLSRGHAIMKSGNVLVLFSDGIFERQNYKQEEFGLNGIKDVIKRNIDKSAAEIINAIFEASFKFGGSRKWEDDATIVVVKKT